MALPIIEQIAAEVVARLQAITTGNGYEFTAESVTRPRRIDRDFTPRNYSIVVDQAETQENNDYSYPGNPPAQGYDATFSIYGFIRESDVGSTSPAVTENQIEAAIKKSIADSATWHNFDGNAVDSSWGSSSPISESQNLPFTNTDHNGVMVPLVVSYRVSELDPFVVR